MNHSENYKKEIEQAKEIYKQLFNDEINITFQKEGETIDGDPIGVIDFDGGYCIYQDTPTEWIVYEINVSYGGYHEPEDVDFDIVCAPQRSFLQALTELYRVMQLEDLNRAFEIETMATDVKSEFDYLNN